MPPSTAAPVFTQPRNNVTAIIGILLLGIYLLMSTHSMLNFLTSTLSAVPGTDLDPVAQRLRLIVDLVQHVLDLTELTLRQVTCRPH